jgi:hypothetical protein
MEHQVIIDRIVRASLCALCTVGLTIQVAAQQFGVGSAQSALVFQPGIMTTLTGNGTSGHSGDGGLATSAEVTNGIRGIAADTAGDVFFADDTNDTVRVVYEGGATAAQLITAENPTVTSPQAGYIYDVAGVEGSSGGPSNGTLGSSAHLKPGAGLALDAAGDVYFNDTGTNKVWVIYAGGSETTGTNLIVLETGVAVPQLGYLYGIAGNSSTSGDVGNGVLATATGVEFHGINDMKFDASGDMYIVDQGNCAIREVSASNGKLTTIVGNGTCAVQANNGPAISTELDQPYGIAVDASGDLYIADKGSVNQIRLVYEGGSAAAALITTGNPSITNPTVGYIYDVAGGGSATYPYGGLATSSKMSAPTMVALDSAGNIYIADNSTNLIDEVNILNGTMTVVAGDSKSSYAGDGGSALSAEISGIRCVAVDAGGRIYITDATNLRVREVSQGIVVFPGQAANTTSVPQTIQLDNNGNAALDFTGGSPAFEGPNASAFAVDTSSPSDTCNLTPLQSGTSCTLTITYSPVGSGASMATLSYATNGVLSPQQITLQGLILPGTTTTLQDSSPSVIDGITVTFTATVTGTASPTGSVSFANGGVVLGTATLSSGVAVLNYSTTATGSLSVIATYAGDANNAGSMSNAVAVNVTGSATSSTALQPSAPTVNQGQSVTLAATVTGGGATPTGSVAFTEGSASLGSVPLNNSGLASLSTTTLPVGPNSIQALYLGNAAYAASSSLTMVQVYGTPVVTLSASPTVVNQGLTETLMVTVTGNGVTPTGTVTFYSGSTVLGTQPLSSGTATLTTTTLPGGPDSLTVAYGGDSSYNAADSNTVSVTVNIENVAFVHPGGWLSVTDINRIRTAVANQTQPYYSAYLALPSSPSTTYTPNPSAVVTAGTVNSGSLTALQGDEENAWILALKWVATGNQAYATALCGVIDGWSNVLTTMNGNNGSLRAGIYGGKLAEAAEICAYANPSWPNKARAQAMFRQAFAQDIHDLSDSNIPNGNWETSCIHGMISIAIFLDDRNLFNRAVNYYLFGQGNGRVSNYVIDSAGQVQESGRDQGHTLDGINHLAETAEDAWHQGIDLYGAYNNILYDAFEYTGEYTTGTGTPPFTPNRDAWNDPLNSYYTLSGVESPSIEPNWELVYNHYVNRQGLAAPYITDVVTASGYRPEPASQDFAGMGTLEFTRSPGQVDPVTTIPAAPIILSGYDTPSGVVLNWTGSVGASSYDIERSSTSGGPYATIATVSGESTYSYTDASASGSGTPYYYIVTASNAFGTSAAGAEARASSGLPSPWANADIGTPGLAGRGGTDYLGASSFALRASGFVIGNSNATLYYNGSNTVYSPSSHSVTPLTDSFQFAYVSMTGNGQIVARVDAPLTPVASSAGLMMRDSLNSNAAMIADMVEYTGLAVATARTADGATATASGPVTISAATSASPDESSLLEAPYWVMLTRLGNTFTASVSADDINWTQVSQQSISMPATIYAGLALASGNSTLPATATFDEVSLPGWTQPATIPAAPANLSAVVRKGVELTWSASVGATSYTLQRNGTTIATIQTPVAGSYAAPQGTIQYTDYTGTAGSDYSYAVSATGAGGTGPESNVISAVAPSLSAPFIENSVFVPYVVGTVGAPLSYQVHVSGLAIFGASGLPPGLTIDPASGLISGMPTQGGSFQAVISASNSAGTDSWPFQFTIAGGALPAGMQQTDIGFLEAPGIAGTNGASTITNTGTGAELGVVCDILHFAYYQLTGDGTIVVNLNSVVTANPTTALSTTGIMMRNTLTCDSLMIDNHAGIGGATSVGSSFRNASNSGGMDYLDASSAGGPSVTLPAYLKLARSGNTFTASSSPDGVTWTQFASPTIAMNPTIYVGLEVLPDDDSPTNTSTGVYSDLAISSASPSLIDSPGNASGTVGVPFSFTLTSAISPATFGATGLPSGLSLNSSTGAISGTPATAGTYSVTASAVNGVASGNAPLSIVIGKGTATVNLGNLAQTYDGSPESASVTTASGNYAVQVTYNGSTSAPTAAGSYSTVATVNDANYQGSATGTLVISPALLTVTANNASRTVGAANPTFTGSYSGFVGGDTAAVLSGAPSLTTTATTSSPAGLYPITAAVGTLSAANYTFTFVSGTLSVVTAPSVSLTTTTSVSGTHSAGYTLTITVKNTSTATASNVALSAAMLGTISGTPLPQTWGTLAGGATATFTVTFPGSGGLDGAGVAEKYSGTYSGGTFSSSLRSVTLP